MSAIKKKKSGHVKQQKKGRVCKKPGCTNPLSVYNPEECCYVHHSELKKERDL